MGRQKNFADDTTPFYLPEEAAKALLVNKYIKKAGFTEARPDRPIDPLHPFEPKPLYSFTPLYADYLDQQLNQLEKCSGMLREHAEKIMQAAILNNMVIGERAVNKNARKILAAGGVGKSFLYKGKSSEGGHGGDTFDPTAGYIPYDQSISKLSPDDYGGDDKHYKDALYKYDVEHFNEENKKSIDKGHATKKQLIEKGDDGITRTWFYEDGQDGNKKFFYKKDDTGNYYSQDSKTQEEKPFTPSSAEPAELEVIADKKGRYVAADYDPLIYALKIILGSLQSFITLTGDHHSKLTGKEENDVIVHKGYMTIQEDAISTALSFDTDEATTHGAEIRNPIGFLKDLHGDLTRGLSMFMPDGKLEIIQKEEPLEGEKELIKIFNKNLKLGYSMFPNPRWGWEIGKDENGKKEFIPPKEPRFDWYKAHNEIKSLASENKAQGLLARKIFNLEIALREHQYRTCLLGDDYQSNDGNLIKAPFYVDGSNESKAYNKLKAAKNIYTRHYGKNLMILAVPKVDKEKAEAAPDENSNPNLPLPNKILSTTNSKNSRSVITQHTSFPNNADLPRKPSSQKGLPRR
jgi:hypothetical protein